MQSTMRVQVEVLHGPAQGQRVIVSPEIPLIVGRAAGVGLCIPEDPTVSRQHFQISLSPPDCSLKSLSSNGTWVNKEEITEIVLFDGDEIRIGADSIFRVRMLNDYVYDAQPTVAQKLPRGAVPPSPTYLVETCSSGLIRFTGGNLPGTPAEVLRRLAGKGKVYAIVDFRRLGTKPPENLTPDAVLFDWLPPEVALENSPLFLDAASPEFAPLLETGWGKDAIVLVLSQSEPAAVSAHLRSALRFNAQGKPSTGGGGFLGICWPAILDQLLSNGSAGLIDNFMNGIDGILLESAESPCGWQILGRPAFSEVLEDLGWESDPVNGKSRKKK